MKKIALFLVIVLMFSACAKAESTSVSSSVPSSSEVTSSDIAVSEAVISETASDAAVSKAAEEVTVVKAAEKVTGTKATEKASASKPAEKAPASKAGEEATTAKTDASKSTTKAVTGANFLSKVETKIIDLLNEERAAEGLGELVYNEDLRSAARTRSRELYKADKFSHKRPNGDGWETVIKEDIPIKFHSAGENLCMTQYNDPSVKNATTASFWFNEWVNSPPHYENIMNEEFNQVGVGVYYVVKNGMTYAYATTIFAYI